MGIIEKGLAGLPAYPSLLSDIKAGRTPGMLTGLGHIHKAMLIHALRAALDRRVFVLVSDEAEGNRLCEDMKALGDEALFLPARELSLRRVESTSREYEQMRLGVLSRMAAEDFDCVVACVDAAAQYTLPPETLLSHTLRLTAGGPLPVKDLAVALAAAGYERCDQIEGAGQFAVRGGIVDVYPADSPAPVRAELWGDTVDTLSYFDRMTQRRTDPLKAVAIPPAAEILYDDGPALADKIEALASGLRGKGSAAQRQNLLADVDRLRGGGLPASLDKYIPLIYAQPATLFDYAGPDALVFVSELGKVRERVRTAYRMAGEYVRRTRPGGRVFIVHRLDRDTSGVLLFAKDEGARRAYQEDWNSLALRRGYLAVTEGAPPRPSGTVRSLLRETSVHRVYSGRGGKEAVTHYTTRSGNGKYALLELSIDTGRKNQIRVHLSELGCPVAGDGKYGDAEFNRRLGVNRQQLNARSLTLVFGQGSPLYYLNGKTFLSEG